MFLRQKLRKLQIADFGQIQDFFSVFSIFDCFMMTSLPQIYWIFDKNFSISEVSINGFRNIMLER